MGDKDVTRMSEAEWKAHRIECDRRMREAWLKGLRAWVEREIGTSEWATISRTPCYLVTLDQVTNLLDRLMEAAYGD